MKGSLSCLILLTGLLVLILGETQNTLKADEPSTSLFKSNFGNPPQLEENPSTPKGSKYFTPQYGDVTRPWRPETPPRPRPVIPGANTGDSILNPLAMKPILVPNSLQNFPFPKNCETVVDPGFEFPEMEKYNIVGKKGQKKTRYKSFMCKDPEYSQDSFYMQYAEKSLGANMNKITMVYYYDKEGKKFKFCFFIAFLVFVCEGTNWESKSQDSLKLVVVVHRHGARTPTRFYKNDPYSNVEKYWPEGLGQLTLKGKYQMYNIGKFLRQRYSNFISRFTVDTVKVFSSDADRCLMSSDTLLAGMFPPAKDQEWTEDLNWQPIPIHTIPKAMDSINGKASCPRFDLEYSKAEEEIDSCYSESLKDLYKYLTAHSGTNVSKVNAVRKLYSTLRCEEVNGLPLPSWVEGVYPDQLKEIVKLSIASNTWTDLLKRLRGGPLLKEILGNLKSKANGGSKNKLHFYSIHDTGIVSLYRTLGFEKMILPDYGATFIFELHDINRQPSVKMFTMTDTYSPKLEELQFPYCNRKAFCPLETILKATEAVVPEDWDQECQLDTMTK